MYSKFNYEASVFFHNSVLNSYYDIGQKLYEQSQKKSRECLKTFLLDNGHIDGTSLKNRWFNIIDADVFISHSHQDIEKVKAFAGWLKDTFNLKVFIDSCVWGYCDDLLKLIDDQYCKHPDGKTYDYQLRNYTTSHVHTMLSSALLEMIDKTECLIFYNTPRSIYLESELGNVKQNKKTLSPWIYNELSAVSILQQRKPSRLRRLHESFEHRGLNRIDDSKRPSIEYDVSAIVENMTRLNDDILKTWANKHNNAEHSLDTLYKIVSVQ